MTVVRHKPEAGTSVHANPAARMFFRHYMDFGT